MYALYYTRQAAKDTQKLKGAKLDRQAKSLLSVIQQNPYQIPPPYEKLRGDLKGAYSRRINLTHRLVYEVYEDKRIVRVVSMWTHYE